MRPTIHPRLDIDSEVITVAPNCRYSRVQRLIKSLPGIATADRLLIARAERIAAAAMQIKTNIQ
jgi:hypothetical protein